MFVIPAKAGNQERTGCRIEACPTADPLSGMTWWALLDSRESQQLLLPPVLGLVKHFRALDFPFDTTDNTIL